MTMHLIRITGVHPQTPDGHRVSFYHRDSETEVTWRGTPPQIGDIIEPDLEQPDQNFRVIGKPQLGAWKADSDALRWRTPSSNGRISRMETLRRRHLIKRAVRDYFDNQNFIEIDAPLLVNGTTPDIAVESFAVQDRYLATSTEYQMKRLAIGGFEKIYSLTQNFREGDTGTYRNPEFTMLEWGRVGVKMTAIEQDAENLTRAAMQALELPDILKYQGVEVDMRGPWQRLSVSEAIERETKVAIKDFSAESCIRALEAAGVDIRSDWIEHGDFLFSLLMDHIQPQLGRDRPTFLTDWPIHQTTSAQQDDRTRLAVRSELFIAGVELSDGFGGLADPHLQMWFYEFMAARRRHENQGSVTLDQRYLDALKLGAPYGAGMALGFDRLIMLLTDQPTIKNVLAFAWDEV